LIRLFAPLLVIIQLTFAIHAFKTGREQKWIWIIMFLPVAGCLAYYFLEVFPGSREERKVREGIRDIAKTLNPDGELKRRAADLADTDSTENKMKLADECLNKGMFDEAINLFQSAATAQFADDPHLLFGQSRAYFYNGNIVDARTTLDRLVRNHPKFRRTEVDLLLARSFEALGNPGEAERIYEALKSTYVGLEAKYRYAIFLKTTSRPAQANEIFDMVIGIGERHKKNAIGQEEWIKLAKQERQKIQAAQ
jgi:hypothetical protein